MEVFKKEGVLKRVILHSKGGARHFEGVIKVSRENSRWGGGAGGD